MKEFQELQDKIGKWSDNTFNGISIEGMILHLQEEVKHLFAQPYSPESYADVQILFMNIARKAGFTIQDIFLATEAKHKINELREWEAPDKQGIFRHK